MTDTLADRTSHAFTNEQGHDSEMPAHQAHPGGFRATFRLLFSEATRRRLGLGTVGTILTGFADAAGVALIVPLMQLLSGSPMNSGILERLADAFGNPSREMLAMYLALVTFGAFVIKGVAVIAFRWWLLGFLGREETEMSTRLLRYYLDAPHSLHLNRNSSDFLRVINDAVSVFFKQRVVGTMNIVSEAVTIVAVAATLIVLVPVPAVMLMAYFAIVVVIFYRVVWPATRRAGIMRMTSVQRVYQDAAHALGGVKEIKIRHKAPYFLRRYAVGRHEFAHAEHMASFLNELPKYLFEVIFIFGIAGLSMYIFATMTPAASVSALAALTAAGFRLLPSVTRLVGALGMVRMGRPSYDLVLADMREAAHNEELMPPSNELDDRLTVRRDVRLDHVTFMYEDRSTPAVSDVCLTIPVGESIALVGPSGAGKSTIVDLLLGIHEPSYGNVVCDGRRISEVLPAWQRSVGLVPQEVYLLDDTLRANIAFGEDDGDVDPERLAEAVAGAQLDELVAQLPERLETFVGERGVRLSGGQRQRIGIARALYTRPELMILDEATSALDNETEQKISETITALQGVVTIVIVAHRLSTVRDCNRVVFLQDGRVSATGTFERLRTINEDFARLVELGSLT